MSKASTKTFLTKENRSIAYVKRYHPQPQSSRGVIFLSGFRSDMTGTKVSCLEDWCFKKRYNFLKFDYSGHGRSSEPFESGCISDWTIDACAVLDQLTDGPQILVGSSMGGWISLLLGRDRSERIAGFVGIAAAPDFTENSMWANFSSKERDELEVRGKVELPTEYSSDPCIITKKLIEDGRSNLVLDSSLEAPYPIRLLQGMQDNDVHFSTSIKLAEHINHNDVEVTLVKDADHQFSTKHCLNILKTTIEEFLIT